MANKIWLNIANAIEERIKSKEFLPGDKLPTEAELSREFMVNRHTLRRALSHLQECGLVESTQGRGSYVRRPALSYSIGKRTRFTDVLTNQAIEAHTRTLGLETTICTQHVADALQIKTGDKIIALKRLGLANGEPITISQHHFSHARFPSFATYYEKHLSVTKTLLSCGVMDFTRKRTVVQSRLPTPDECKALQLPKHVPLIVTKSWNVDAQGLPLEYGESLMASDRVELDISSSQPDHASTSNDTEMRLE